MPPKQNDNKAPDKIEACLKTAEWLIMAFAVTLVFIVFEMQAYTIPTGSMADTLKGAHFRFRCPECGYRYDYGFMPDIYGIRNNGTPAFNVPLVKGFERNRNTGQREIVFAKTHCPSCGFYMNTQKAFPVVKGDRIFVAKCIYQFTEPKRWDVVVFKNPLEPRINYIKRLIGKPNETVEIIDGDIYIDGEIARKPAKVQDELWMPVFENDYQPAKPGDRNFNGDRWVQPFENVSGSQWDLGSKEASVFKLQSSPDEVHAIDYNTQLGNDFRATYAYNDVSYYSYRPLCSDLMVRFYVRCNESGSIGAELSKYRARYRATVDFSGRMTIESLYEDGAVVELVSHQVTLPDVGSIEEFKFTNVDHMITLAYGDVVIEYDLGTLPDDAGDRMSEAIPMVRIFGGGDLELTNVGIYRDIHYIGDRVLRAGEGDPFTLEDDEFFACGDNSPASLDGRLWAKRGVSNDGNGFRMGVVPREYMIGKAFFVYWPGPAKAWDSSKLRLIPYVGGMKLIYGGTL